MYTLSSMYLKPDSGPFLYETDTFSLFVTEKNDNLEYLTSNRLECFPVYKA